MAAPGSGISAVIPGKFSFPKSATFLDGQVSASFDVEAPAASAIAIAIAADDVVPPGSVMLGTISASLSGGTADVKLGSDMGTVSFNGSGAFRSGIGFYEQPTDLLADLDPDGSLLNGLALPGGAARYSTLNWGYNISAKLQGSVSPGLGTTVTFGADGQTEGLFALIRAYDSNPHARQAVAELIEGWRLPRRVTSARDLQPGTWIVAEVDGSIALKAGAQFGYDYTWLKNVNLLGLSGDIGLRLQAAASVAVGFQAAGKYLLVVGRESLDPAVSQVRVRVFKMAKKGWDFALNAGVSVTGINNGFLPGELDDFIAAVFGVHGAQVVADLRTFRDWVNPAVPLPQKFAGFVSQYVTNQLATNLGTEIQKFEEARQRVQKFLDDWDNLGHRVSTVIWSIIRKGGQPAADFETVLRGLATGQNDDIKALVVQALSDVEFFRSPTGQWLESIITGNLLGAALNAKALQDVRTGAQQVLKVLDGGVVTELVHFVDTKLKIDQVKNIVNQAQFANLEPWLTDRLTKFLGKTFDFTQVEQVRKVLFTLDQRAQELYTQALKALTNTYGASLAFTYSSATTKTALVDVTLDFQQNPGLGSVLRDAINGNFNELLLTPLPGVTLTQARLTHGIERRSHLELNLPHFNATVDKLTNSLASVQEDAGRLLVYELNADDTMVARRKWQGTVSMTAKIAVQAGSQVNLFLTNEQLADGMTYSARFQQVFPQMRTQQIQTVVQPLIQPYFPHSFGSSIEPKRASLAEWAMDLDKHADATQDNGTGMLGNTLLTLDVSLPGKVVAAWLNAPADAKDPAYMRMSRNIQRAMRRLIPYCYFDDPGRYVDRSAIRGSAAALMVYQCLPASTAIKFSDGKVTLDQASDTYWEFNDQRFDNQNERFAMVFHPFTAAALVRLVGTIQPLLMQIPNLRGFASDFDGSRISAFQGQAYSQLGHDILTQSLLFSEAETITHCIAAGQAMAKFSAQSGKDPEAALEGLANAGDKLTSTFNSKLNGTLFGGRSFRELASLVFLEAAKAFDPSLATIEPAARLNVVILKKGAPATFAQDFLSGTVFDPSVIALEQPVVSLPI